jgi:hypothetical protein
MEQETIPSTESKLVTTTRYVSPVYIAEYDGIQIGGDVDRPDTIKFKSVKEDNIFPWLANNSLGILRSPFPGHSHSNIGFLFMTKEGAHIISYSQAEVNPIAPIYRTT